MRAERTTCNFDPPGIDHNGVLMILLDAHVDIRHSMRINAACGCWPVAVEANGIAHCYEKFMHTAGLTPDHDL